MNGTLHAGAMVRPAHAADLEQVRVLMAEHAAFERAPAPVATVAALAEAMDASAPVLAIWVAVHDGVPVGYLSATREFSTWLGRAFVHMDCLYLRPGWRGVGLGAALLDALRRHARDLGIDQLQWQTPEWNEEASRFYRRMGAQESRKRRFVLVLGPVPG